MTRQELMAVLGLKDRKHFADAYLKPALVEGKIKMTQPDKPNSRLQKYRRTQAAEDQSLGRKETECNTAPDHPINVTRYNSFNL